MYIYIYLYIYIYIVVWCCATGESGKRIEKRVVDACLLPSQLFILVAERQDDAGVWFAF